MTNALYSALSAIVSRKTSMDLLALNRLQEPVAYEAPKVNDTKPLVIATSCGRCTELVTMEMSKYTDKVPHPYCDLCMDELTRRYPEGVL